MSFGQRRLEVLGRRFLYLTPRERYIGYRLMQLSRRDRYGLVMWRRVLRGMTGDEKAIQRLRERPPEWVDSWNAQAATLLRRYGFGGALSRILAQGHQRMRKHEGRASLLG